MTGSITGVTRRRLTDGLYRVGRGWSGDLEEYDFLGRIYDLRALPSFDSRCDTAEDDIVQHRVANWDWDADWIFTDERFDIATSDTGLLRFLAEGLHPEVRRDEAEARRLGALYNELLRHDGYEIVESGAISGAPVFGWRRIGAASPAAPKNLIFAARYKPDIVIADAVNNEIQIVRNEHHCLVFDEPIGGDGLTIRRLRQWWGARARTPGGPREGSPASLTARLRASMGDNEAEQFLFDIYQERCDRLGDGTPALLPQVYLHYDPRTASERGPGRSPLTRQRMDFLLLFPGGARVVLEVDGIEHYADDTRTASPPRYAAMVSADRELRLKGYEVYRFGGAELRPRSRPTAAALSGFFDRLAERHGG